MKNADTGGVHENQRTCHSSSSFVIVLWYRSQWEYDQSFETRVQAWSVYVASRHGELKAVWPDLCHSVHEQSSLAIMKLASRFCICERRFFALGTTAYLLILFPEPTSDVREKQAQWELHQWPGWVDLRFEQHSKCRHMFQDKAGTAKRCI